MIYLLTILLLAIVFIFGKALPIISGYGAKILCSGIFVSNRTPEEVIRNDIGFFPFSLARYVVNRGEASVSATIWGLARKKAIYRKGLGATLINGISEKQLRAQSVRLAMPPVVDLENTNWPLGDRVTSTIPGHIDQQQLTSAIEEAFSETRPGKRNTRAIVVVYNGQIIAERYAPGFSKHTQLPGWSMAKSITSALTGILVGMGRLNLSDRRLLPHWKNDDRKNITLTHLLQMTSGLRWWEYYKAPSDVTNMLFKARSMPEAAGRNSLRHEPGTVFNYSSGSTNIISGLIRQAVGEEDYYCFPYEQLLFKLGMYHTVLEPDAGGTFVGSSYCYSTARDWARFGLLYLNDGVWNGERILPEGWVKFTATAAKARYAKGEGKYGAQWWVNAPDPSDPTNPGSRKYPHVPEDCFYCQGYEGQNCWVIPSKNLVVARLAMEHGDPLNPDIFLPKIINAIKV